MKKILGILFLLIMSFQIMPVKALGKFLHDGVLTEDVMDEDGSAAAEESFKHPFKIAFFSQDNPPAPGPIAARTNRQYHPLPDAPVLAHFLAKPPTPPPNCA